MELSLTIRRCLQCYAYRTYPDAFIGRRGRPVKLCKGCQDRYYGWADKPAEERARMRHERMPWAPSSQAKLYPKSGNKKLGGLPSSITARGSCPPSCGLYEKGCYAEYHLLAAHWRRVGTSAGETWDRFCLDVEALPEGQLWRHNEAGDLPGDGDTLDTKALDKLVRANARAGARGFTFTHKPMTSPEARTAVRRANMRGFTVNLSADSLEEADELADLCIAPVVVVVPEDAPDRMQTPTGRTVLVCLYDKEGLTCAECRLCAHPTRRSIIAFRAHGQGKLLVTELVREKRLGDR